MTNTANTKAATLKTFTVIYRTGGTENFKWHRTLEVFSDYLAADRFAASVERQGYFALIHDTARLDAIGLPDDYEVWAKDDDEAQE